MIFNNKTLAKILAGIVMLGGLVVMFGWFLNIPMLTSLLPQWVTMKFITALSFFLSGLILYFIIEISEGRRELPEIVIPITSFSIFILMVTLLISVIIGVKSGIEDLFVREAAGAVKTIAHGRPSVGTMVSFILIVVAGILSMFDYDKTKKYLKIIGIGIAIIAIIAIFGYIINVPLLYYAFEGWSTAMAFHTAFFFLFFGVGLILLYMRDIFVKQNIGEDKSLITNKLITKSKTSDPKNSLKNKLKGSNNKIKNKLIWTILIIGLVIILSFIFLQSKQEIKEIQPIENLEEHYLYKNYEFSDDKKVIDIGVQPLWIPTSLISEVMKKDEILKEELNKLGYSIRFHNFLKGNDINYFLEKGDLEAGIGGDMPAIRIASINGATSVSLIQEGPVSIVSRDIQEIKQLKNKKIGYALGSNAHFYLLNTLKKNGINPSEVYLIQMDVTEMPDALSSKQVDAFSAWEPTPFITLEKYPDFIITHSGTSYGFLYVEKEMIQKNPEIVKLLIASEIRSLRWIKENNGNIDLAASLVIETAKEFVRLDSELSINEIVYLAKKDLPGILIKKYPRINFELISEEGFMKKEFDFLKELELISSNISWNEIKQKFNLEIIEEVINDPEKYRIFEGGISNGI